MKYEIEIDVNLPRDKVIALFDDTENLKKWMPGLVIFEPMSGEPGQVGAQSKIVVSTGKNNCEMIETITVRNLPDEFTGVYTTDGMWNENKNLFTEVNENTTRWKSVNEFKSDKLLMKLMMFLMPGAFKKESLKFMQSFKTFAEK
ncbi:SRPBCC family protein [Aliikangiella marina]|uniref:SRPBCC family protein n=1 Tax=Aliikangiella marina TaxID=1712262 RepID=A0A545TC09_9GAMM|nr:SRPBCC family protein [Aliikangiella marina]TQV74739.1 SRPBCC family protein [Aliikangiella marina]